MPSHSFFVQIAEQKVMKWTKRKLERNIRKQLKPIYRKGKKEGEQLLATGLPIAYLSYAQIPPHSRKRERKSWPNGLATDLANTLINTNMRHVWLDKMGYPDIKTLGPASGLRPYASDNGMVVVRGAFGKEYSDYHFIGECGSYMEMAVQTAMEKDQHFRALRWTAMARLWPSAEVAIGVMHGRICLTKATTVAGQELLAAIKACLQMIDTTPSVEKDMGFAWWKRKVRCKACGNMNKRPHVIDWKASTKAIIFIENRIQNWMERIQKTNGGVAEETLVQDILGPMWSAPCFDENDRISVATLTSFLWIWMGPGGTELFRNLTDLVGKPDALTKRIVSAIGYTNRPKLWYESIEKMLDRLVEQSVLSQSAKYGTQDTEWMYAVWFYPTPGRGFFGNLTFSDGKSIILETLRGMSDDAWPLVNCILSAQQRSLWPVVGNSLPWYFTSHEGKHVVLLPALLSPRNVDGQSMGVQVGNVQYCLEGEVDPSTNKIVVQVPIGSTIIAKQFTRESSGLVYLGFVLEDNGLRLVAMRPCNTSRNAYWCNIEPQAIVRNGNDDAGHTPPQKMMFGANGFPRDYSNLYDTWNGSSDFAHLGTLDDRNIVDEDIKVAGRAIRGRSVGWTWMPVKNQEEALAAMEPRAAHVLLQWTRPWM